MTDVLFDVDPGVGLGAGGEGGEATEGQKADVASLPLLDIHVLGIPAPQGSKKGFYNPRINRVQIVDDNKRPLRDWRSDVKTAAETAIVDREGTGDPFAILGGPVGIDVTFLLARPKGHYRTGRNAHLLRDGAPARPTTKPDVDKLIRSTLDALKAAGVYLDDSQVVTVTGRKHYATDRTGAHIHVYAGDNA